MSRQRGKRRHAAPLPPRHEAREQEADLIPMSALQPKIRAWLWEQRIPRGALTLLTGKKGASKSTFGSEIATIVTTGRCFPGSDAPVAPGNVLLIVREEEVEKEPRARAEEQGADLARLFVLDPNKPLPWAGIRDPTLRMQARNDWLERQIRRHEIRCLLIDPIASVIVHKSGIGLRDELTELARLLARHNVACVGIAHLVKCWGGTIIGTIRGGGEWSEVARSVLAVARLNPSDPRSPIVFGVAESNMAVGNVPYLAYRLESPPGHPERVRLVWMDDADLPAEVSLDDLVKRACKAGKILTTKSAQVDAALLEILANGAMLPEREVKVEVKQRVGAGDRTIEERKRALGIESKAHGGRWYWSLPAPPQPAPQPATAEEVSPNGGEHALPVERYVEAARRQGKSPSEILATLDEHATKTTGEDA